MAEIGAILEGKVSGITKFGAFVAFEDGKSGLVHISEISREYVEDINQILKMGQTVSVKVLSIDDKGKIALSIRQTLPDAGPERTFKPKRERSFAPRAPRPAPTPFDPAVAPVEFTPMPGKNSAPAGSFEEKMLRFKQDSEDKIHSLKRESGGRHRGGTSKRG